MSTVGVLLCSFSKLLCPWGITANFVFYCFEVTYIHALKEKQNLTIFKNDTLNS